jgi:TonB family protein
MVWASGAGDGHSKPLPSATTVHLIQPRAMPATPGKISERIPEGAQPKQPPKMPLPDALKKKPEKPEPEDLATNDVQRPKAPPSDATTRPGAGGTELKGDAGTLKVQGSGFGEYNFYLAVVQSKIESNFRPPPGVKAQSLATIGFSILKNGQIANVQKVKTSGNLLIDQSAERAVRAAGRFPPLPPQYEQGQLDIYFEFVINPLAQR